MIVGRNQRRGATAVESAFVLLLVFVLLLGIIVGGTGVFRHEQAACLAREASRWASVRGGNYFKDATGTPPTRQQIIDQAVLPRAAGISPDDINVAVEWIDRGTGTATDWDAATKDVWSVAATGEYVTNAVRVTVTIRVGVGVFGDPVTVQGTSELPMSN